MNHRKFFIVTLLLAAVCILILAALNFAILQLKFKSDKIFSGIDDREYNSVIAAKQSFNAAILGSSMSQGFHCSDLDKAFQCRSLKLTYSGANLAEIKFMADYAYKFQKIDYILLDCHIVNFENTDLSKVPVDYYSSKVTILLLKKSFSINALEDSRKTISRYFSGKFKQVSRDDLYDWNLRSSCGEKRIANAILYQKHPILNFDQPFTCKSIENIKKYLVPLLENHKETKFLLFFPPYSVMYYKGNNVSRYLQFKKEVMELLLKYDNLELHDFQTEFAITEKLDNYKDLTHYSGKISQWIIEHIKLKTHIVTLQNYERYLDKLRDQLLRYDYQAKYDELKIKYKK